MPEAPDDVIYRLQDLCERKEHQDAKHFSDMRMRRHGKKHVLPKSYAITTDSRS
jgi:hypothetical protein